MRLIFAQNLRTIKNNPSLTASSKEQSILFWVKV